jgi:K+-sensing histidine kinase KdpD
VRSAVLLQRENPPTKPADINPEGFFNRQSFPLGFSSASFRLSASVFCEQMMRNNNNTGYLFRLKPWSLSAFALALLALLLAATMQAVLTSFGSTLQFATFFPAILVASLLAGAPAGIFAAALTIPIVWWAFMPPYFEFNPLTPADCNSFVLFLLCTSLVIWISHLYREALVILRK